VVSLHVAAWDTTSSSIYLHTEEIPELAIPFSIKVNNRHVEVNDILLREGNPTRTEDMVRKQDARKEQTYATFQSKPVCIVPYVPNNNASERNTISFQSLGFFNYRKTQHHQPMCGVSLHVEKRGADAVSIADMKLLAWLWKIKSDRLLHDKKKGDFSWDPFFEVLDGKKFRGIGAGIAPLNSLLEHIGFNYRYGTDTNVYLANRHFKLVYQCITNIRVAAYDGNHRIEIATRLFNGMNLDDAVPCGVNGTVGKILTNSTLCLKSSVQVSNALGKRLHYTTGALEELRNTSSMLSYTSTLSFESQHRSMWKEFYLNIMTKFFGSRSEHGKYTAQDIYTMDEADFDSKIGGLMDEISVAIISVYCRGRVSALRGMPKLDVFDASQTERIVGDFKTSPLFKSKRGVNMRPIPDSLDDSGLFKARKFYSALFNRKEFKPKHDLHDDHTIHALLTIFPVMMVCEETRKTMFDFVSSSKDGVHNPYRIIHYQATMAGTFIKMHSKNLGERGPKTKKAKFLINMSFLNDNLGEVAERGYKDPTNWKPRPMPGLEQGQTAHDILKNSKELLTKNDSRYPDFDVKPETVVHRALMTYPLLVENLNVDILNFNSYGGGLCENFRLQSLFRRSFSEYLKDVISHEDDCLNPYAAEKLGVLLQPDRKAGKPYFRWARKLDEAGVIQMENEDLMAEEAKEAAAILDAETVLGSEVTLATPTGSPASKSQVTNPSPATAAATNVATPGSTTSKSKKRKNEDDEQDSSKKRAKRSPRTPKKNYAMPNIENMGCLSLEDFLAVGAATIELRRDDEKLEKMYQSLTEHVKVEFDDTHQDVLRSFIKECHAKRNE